MLLTFLSPLFYHSRLVYMIGTAVSFLISIVDGLVALCSSLNIENFTWLKPIVTFYENTLPFYGQGLGWLIPVLVTIVVTGVFARVFKLASLESPKMSDI